MGLAVVIFYSPSSVSTAFSQTSMGRHKMEVMEMEQEMDVEKLQKPKPRFLFFVWNFVLEVVFDVLPSFCMVILIMQEVDPSSWSMVLALALNLERNGLQIPR